MWAMIATWRMALEGITAGGEMLEQGAAAGEALEKAICDIEDFPYYKSVGYGGLPNEEMEVELDAAYMDGDTFDIGAVAAIKDFANPIKVAKRLSAESVNCMLVSEGAEKFAHKEGFERKNMLTDRAKICLLYTSGVNEALQKALSIAKREGLITKNVDGYMGYGQYGEGENYIGVMGHLDVVEIGDGWRYPAFSATIAENRIWGRGALDNKGPLFAAFYGLSLIHI